MKKKSSKLISLMMAILMLLEMMAPSLYTRAQEEPVDNYTIQALDEKVLDESISLSMKHSGLLEKRDPELESDILVNLETKATNKDIKLVLRDSLALFDLNSFDSLELAKKEYKAIKDYYAKQGLDIDISIKVEDGRYKIHNNYKDTYEEGLYGLNYEAYHFTVLNEFDFLKNGLQNKLEGESKPERLYVFDLQVYEAADKSLSMIKLKGDKKDPVELGHEGDLIGALVDDKYISIYKASFLADGLKSYYEYKAQQEKKALDEEAKAEKPEAEKPEAEKPEAEKPVAEKPEAEKPVAEKPVAEKPEAEKPVAEKPEAEKPVAEKPEAEKPEAEKPEAEKPVAEKPEAEKPVAEKPVAEKPVAEKPEAEKPVAEKPVAGKVEAGKAPEEKPVVATEQDKNKASNIEDKKTNNTSENSIDKSKIDDKASQPSTAGQKSEKTTTEPSKVDSKLQNGLKLAMSPLATNQLRPLRAGGDQGFANKKFKLQTSIKALASPTGAIPKGWYVDINIGPYLKPDPDNPIKGLVVNGKTVANGEYLSDKNVIRYTFNQSVDTTTDIPIQQLLVFDTQAIGDQDPVKIQISVNPKNNSIQYMPIITVKSDDPRDVIDSSTQSESGSITTDYPYSLGYSYTTKLMSGGREVPFFDANNAPNDLEVWWDFEIDGSALFKKDLDFKQLNIAMYGSANQDLYNFKYGVSKSKEGLNDNLIYKNSGTLGEIHQANTFVSKDYVRTSVGQKIYIRIKAKVKPDKYHEDYSMGLRINPDSNYVKKIVDDFKAKYDEVRKKFPFLIGYIEGIEGADKFASVPFNLVDGMFTARTIMNSKEYDEQYYHDGSRMIIADRVSNTRTDWYALDLIRMGEEEDPALLNPGFSPNLSGNTEVWYLVPKVDGSYLRTRNKSDAMLNGQFLPGTLISYKYINQSGLEMKPYKYTATIKEKGVDLANVYSGVSKEGGYIQLYNLKTRINTGVDLQKDYIAYVEDPYQLFRINRNFDLVQCYNQSVAAPVYDGKKSKTRAIAHDKVDDPSGEFLISRLTGGANNNLVSKVSPGGSLNQGDKTRGEAIKSLYKRIYYYADVVNRDYAKNHAGKDMHRMIYGDMIQRVLHYYTDEANISHRYGGYTVENRTIQMQDNTLTGSLKPDGSPKGDAYTGTNRPDRHNYNGYRKLADNESIIDHRYPTINEDQETYARKLLSLVEESYRSGTGWDDSKENTVDLTFYRHSGSGNYQELINGKVTDPIELGKIATVGGKEVPLAGATFTFINRSTGEKVTWTSKEDNSNNPLHLGLGTYIVEETVSPPGYGKLKPFDIRVFREEINPDHGPYGYYFLPDIHVNDGYQTKVEVIGSPSDIKGNPLVTAIEEMYVKDGQPSKEVIAKLLLKARNIPIDLGELKFMKMTPSKTFKLTGSEFTLTKLKANSEAEAKQAASSKDFDKANNDFVYRKTSSGLYGEFKFEQMPIGFYLLEETKVPSGYKKLEAKIVEVKKEANGNIKTYFLDESILNGDTNVVVNEPLETKIRLRKIDKKDIGNEKDYPGLEGAKFTLNSIKLVDNTDVDIDITSSATEKRLNDQGNKVSINGGYLEFDGLKQGEYELIETRAPKGYFMPDFYGWKIFVYQKEGSQELDYRVFKLQSQADKILSIEELAKRPGAEISLSKVKKDGASIPVYLLDNTPHEVNWKFAKYVENKNFDPSQPESDTNKRYIKLSGDALKDKDGNPLEFYLYRADYYAHKLSETPIDTLKPDANGDYFLKDLRYGGNFILEEKNPPKGLIKADPIFLKVESERVDGVEKYVVNIRDLNNNIIAEHKQFKGVLDFREGDILGKFKIKKTGKSLWPADNGAEVGLRRAYFRLYEADDNFNINKYNYIVKETEGEALTDPQGNPVDSSTLPANQGIAEFTQLKPGKYVLVEYRGPAGYEKDSDPWYIVVDNQGKVTKYRDKHSYSPEDPANMSFMTRVYSRILRATQSQDQVSFDNDISTITINAGPINEQEGTRDLTLNVKPKEVTKEVSTPKKMHMILMADRSKVVSGNKDVSSAWDDNINRFLTDLYLKAEKEGTDVDISLVKYANTTSKDYSAYVGKFNLKELVNKTNKASYTEYNQDGVAVGQGPLEGGQIYKFTDSMGLGKSYTDNKRGTQYLYKNIDGFLTSIENGLRKDYDTKLAVNFVRYHEFTDTETPQTQVNGLKRTNIRLATEKVIDKGYSTWTFHANPANQYNNRIYTGDIEAINKLPDQHMRRWIANDKVGNIGLAPYVQKDFFNGLLTNDDYFVKKETTVANSLENASLDIVLKNNIIMTEFDEKPNYNPSNGKFTINNINGEVTIPYKIKLADKQLNDRDFPIHNLLTITQSGKEYTHSGDQLESLTVRRKAPESATINISFEANGATGTMGPVVKDKNSEYTLPANGFTPPEGKKFDGWAIKGIKKQPGETIFVGSEDLVIAALWIDKDEGGGGTVVPPGEASISVKLVYKSNTPEPAGFVGRLKLQVKEGTSWVDALDANQDVIAKEVKANDVFDIKNLDPDKEYRVVYDLDDKYSQDWIQTDVTIYDANLKANKDKLINIEIINGDMLTIFNKDENGFRIPLRVSKIDAKDKIGPGESQDKQKLLPGDTKFQARKLIDGEGFDKNGNPPKYGDEPFDTVSEATGEPGDNYFRELTPGIYELWEVNTPSEEYRFPTDSKGNRMKWYFKIEIDPEKVPTDADYMRMVFDFEHTFSANDKFNKDLTEEYKKELIARGTIKGPGAGDKEFNRFIEIVPDTGRSHPARPDAPYQGIDDLQVTNYSITTDLKFKKSDIVTNESLDGIEFRLSKVEVDDKGNPKLTADGSYELSKIKNPNKESETITQYDQKYVSRRVNGVSFENIVEGTYILEELNTIPGYKRITNPILIKFTFDDRGEWKQIVKVKDGDNWRLADQNDKFLGFNDKGRLIAVKNAKSSTDLRFKKVNQNGTPLQYRRFRVTSVDKDGNIIPGYDKERNTLAGNEFFFDNLSEGRYKLIETEYGYSQMPTPWYFNVVADKDGKLEVVFENDLPEGITNQDLVDKSIRTDDGFTIVNYNRTELIFYKFGLDDKGENPLRDIVFRLKKVRTEVGENGRAIYDDQGKVVEELRDHMYESRFRSYNDGFVNFRDLSQGVYELEELNADAYIKDPTKTQTKWILVVTGGDNKLEVKYDRDYENYYYKTYDQSYFNQTYKSYNYKGDEFVKERATFTLEKDSRLNNIRDNVELKWYKKEAGSDKLIESRAQFIIYPMSKDPTNLDAAKKESTDLQHFNLDNSNGIYKQDGLERGIYRIHETIPPSGYKGFEDRDIVVQVIEKGLYDNPDKKLEDLTIEERRLIVNFYELELTHNADQTIKYRMIEDPSQFKYIKVKEVKSQDGQVNHEIDYTPDYFFTIKNYPKVKLVINKKDDTTKQPLEGAEFNLTKIVKNQVNSSWETELNEQGKPIYKQTIKTGQDGKLEFTGLVPGRYELIETKSPFGYEKSQDTWIVIVSEDYKVTVNKVKKNPDGEIDLQNPDPFTFKYVANGYEYPLLDVSAKVSRIEGTNSFYLDISYAGQSYYRGSYPMQLVFNDSLYYVSGLDGADITSITKDVSYTYTGQKITERYVVIPKSSSQFGSPILGWKYGPGLVYDVPQANLPIIAPRKIELCDTVEVTVEEDDHNIDIFNKEKPTDLDFKISKKDGSSPDRPTLEGVRYELRDDEGKLIKNGDLDYWTTDKNGEIHFEKLTPGRYWLKEIKAKDGYILDSTPIAIFLGDNWAVPDNPDNPEDISDNISLDTTKENTIRSTEQDDKVIYPNKSQGFISTLHFKIDKKAEAGDTFVLSLGDKVDFDGIGRSEDSEFDIVGPSGRIAKASINSDRKSITYTFTNYVDEKAVYDFKVNVPFFINKAETFNNEYADISIGIVHKSDTTGVLTKNFYIDFENYISEKVDVKTLVTKYAPSNVFEPNDPSMDLVAVSYVNPFGETNINRVVTFEASLPIKQGKATIYRVPARYRPIEKDEYGNLENRLTYMPWSYGAVDYSKLDYVGTVYIDNEASFTESLGNDQDNSSYVIKVEGKVNGKGVEFTTNTKFDRARWQGDGFYQAYHYWATFNRYFHPDASAAGDSKLNLLNFRNDISYTKVDLDLYKKALGQDGSIDKEIKYTLEGANFELRKLDDAGKYVKVEGTEISSDKDGMFTWSGLTPGKYQVWETKAPEGYATPTSFVSSFEVNESSKIVNVLNNSTTISNEKTPLYFYLNKTDTEDKSIKKGKLVLELQAPLNAEGQRQKFPDGLDKLEGKPYEIAYADQNKDRIYITIDLGKEGIYQEVTAGKQGIKIDIPQNFPEGTYTLKEKSAPYGYKKTDKEYSIDVSIKAKTIIYKEKGKTDVNLYKLGANGQIDLANIGILQIENEKALFPSTGGMGILAFTFLGFAFMVGAVTLQKKKKGEGQEPSM